jgi:2-polyprenyl-3-methyl-5-hydroxy-6-metoxy-1,4-benzoquinol methylase
MDKGRLETFALKVWEYKQGEIVSLMVHLGDQLGLYKAMAGAGSLSADELARRTGLSERWVLEWLRGQGAAGLLETFDGETFELSDEGAEVLAKEGESVWFAAGAFNGCALPLETIPRLMDAFRTGRGLSYEELGPVAAHNVERFTAPWTELVLVPTILPRLSGVVERLETGTKAVDVGCGAGVALVALAAAFPASNFEGFDPSSNALKRARKNVKEAGLSNVSFRLAPAAGLPSNPTYDFVLTLDCLHDMPHPAEAIASIRRAITPEGTWLIKDVRSGPNWAENLRNPMLAMMYGMSVATCLSSGLSEPGGAGLGTLGFHPKLAEEMCLEAGFTRFAVHDFGDPANLYYEVRP